MAVLIAVVLTASGAAAAPTPAERETARRLMDEGKARLKANEPLPAIERFHKAHEIMHVPTTGLALARAHLAAGHLVEARDIALEIGRLPRESGEPTVFEAARKQARELDAQLKPRIPTVRVRIKGASAVHVAIDGVELPATLIGEPVAVNPGKRSISAKSAEGTEAKREIELAEHDAKEIELTFAVGGEASRGEVASTKPVASVPPSASLSTAPHATGGDDLEVRASERTALAKGMIYGGFGVGAVGLAVGLVTGALTLSKAADVKGECENDVCDPRVSGDLDSANTLATVSNIAMIAGGVGLAVGAIGLFIPKRPRPGATIAWSWAPPARRPGEVSVVRIHPTGAGIGGTF